MSQWFIQHAEASDAASVARARAIELSSASGAAIVAICDAHGRGAAAAAMYAVVRERLDDRLQREDGVPTESDAWEEELRYIDRAVQLHPTASTGSVLVASLTDDGIVGASAGACRAWLIGEATWELSRMQYERPWVGSGASRPIGFGPSAIEEAVALGSPSVFKHVGVDDLRTIVADSQEEAPDRIVRRARAAELGRLSRDLAVIMIRRRH